MGVIPSEEFNEQLKRTVRETARRERPNVGSSGRWHKKGGKGGGGNLIRFRITASFFCGDCFVVARVISVPSGRTAASMPDVDVDDNNSVLVYDKTGCFFNEPPEDLVNRLGYAEYMNHLEDGPCGDTFGELWTVISLCCNEDQCGV